MRVFATTEIEENQINNTNIIINDYNHNQPGGYSSLSSLNQKNMSEIIGSVKNIPDIINNEELMNKINLIGEVDLKCYSNFDFMRSIIKKFQVFAQFINSIPNSTFLLTLLNLSNYFMIKNSLENYISALFLTACSMTQARLFIQSVELFTKIQIFILNTENKYFFLKFFFYSNLNSKMLLSSDDNKLSYFLCKIEIIKATCMYEYGNIIGFLESLQNAYNYFYTNNYSSIQLGISWTKSNEIGSNKYYIQKFLNKNGSKLMEILLILLKDQSEIVLVFSLKIIEFILDYSLCCISKFIPKLMKNLLKLITPMSKQCLQISEIVFHKVEDIKYYTKVLEMMDGGDIYFNTNILNKFLIEKYKYKSKPNPQPQQSLPMLLKQVNYILDTLINSMEYLSYEEVLLLVDKTIEIIFLNLLDGDLDGITLTNLLKYVKKLFEISNCNIFSN